MDLAIHEFEAFYKTESMGFEPTVPCDTQHFECCTLNHSDNSPYQRSQYKISSVIYYIEIFRECQ